MLQTVITVARGTTAEILSNKAKRILVDGCCGSRFKWDFFCRLCPVCWACEGPDRIPFNNLRLYLQHNEKLLIGDAEINTDISRNNTTEETIENVVDPYGIVDTDKSYTLNIERGERCT
jgi:hypothetical protein